VTTIFSVTPFKSTSYTLHALPTEDSRLISSVGRRIEHGGRTTVTLTGLHAHFNEARTALLRISGWLQAWSKEAEELLGAISVWERVCQHIKLTIAGIGPPQPLRLTRQLALN